MLPRPGALLLAAGGAPCAAGAGTANGALRAVFSGSDALRRWAGGFGFDNGFGALFGNGGGGGISAIAGAGFSAGLGGISTSWFGGRVSGCAATSGGNGGSVSGGE